VVGAFVFFFQLESFQKQSMLASIPIYFFSAVISSVIFIFGYTHFMMRGMSKMSSQKRKLNAEMLNVKFSDVIGLDEPKREALEVVSLIRDRALIKKIGGKIVKGILMQGPPGCGKTLLA
jgi:cell division protease FtsH